MNLRMMCVLVVLGPLVHFAAGADEASPPTITEITLTRSGDRTGAGPEDVLTLRADNSALYIGRKNVERIGSFTGAIPQHGFSASYPLLAAMYEAIHAQPGSTGKPDETLTAITWRVVREGKAEEITDWCPGIDPRLWAFEMAVRGVVADIAWKKSDDAKDAAIAAPVELKLAPSAAAPDDSILAAVCANAWTWHGLVNILGEGSTQTLRFTRQPGGGMKLESDNQRVTGFKEQKKADGIPPGIVGTTTCDVQGPVLRCDGRPQTFVVVEGKLLVMNALAPAGERTWYYAAAESDKQGKVAHVEEYLFNFADDPLKADAGKGSMRVRIGDYPPKADDFQFKLTTAANGVRYFQIETDGPNGRAVRTRIGLAAGGDYGLMLDNLNLDSKIFSAISAPLR